MQIHLMISTCWSSNILYKKRVRDTFNIEIYKIYLLGFLRVCDLGSFIRLTHKTFPLNLSKT